VFPGIPTLSESLFDFLRTSLEAEEKNFDSLRMQLPCALLIYPIYIIYLIKLQAMIECSSLFLSAQLDSDSAKISWRRLCLFMAL